MYITKKIAYLNSFKVVVEIKYSKRYSFVERFLRSYRLSGNCVYELDSFIEG